MRSFRIAPLILWGLLSPSFPFARADDVVSDPSRPRGVVVVTAAGLEEPIEDTVQHTTVIDAEAIRRSHAPDTVTLLRDQAGLEAVQPGGAGRQTSLFMRGTNSNQTLVLIDGVRASSTTSGATAIDQIPLSAIDRIEIVRGNVSALYGSDAVGGVIQIFTRDGSGHAPGLSASVGAGSYDTLRTSFDYGGTTQDGLRFNVGVGSYDTHGFSSIRSQYIPTPGATRLQDLDKDAYHQRSATFSLSKEWAPGHTVGANGLYSDAKVFYDGTYADESLPRISTLSAHSDDAIAAWWKSRVAVSRGTDTLPSLLDGQQVGYARTVDDQVSWHNQFDLGAAGRVTAGLENLSQRLDSDTAYVATSRRVNSALLGWLGRFGAHTLQVDARADSYSDFGHHDSTLAGYGYDLSDRWHASASVSTAFRAPTFIDLYDPYFGNPAVRPETARSAEIALQYRSGEHTVRLAGFRNRVHDLIEYVAPSFRAVNVDQASIDGAELTWTARWNDTRVSAALTLQDPRDTTTGERLLRRAGQFGSVEASQRFGAWRVGLQALASGSREDLHVTQYTPVRLGGYTVVNAVADYRVDARQSVAVRIDNLLNKDFEVAHGYNVQRLAVMATWRYDIP
jgi:vitamin B12 transporter